MARNKVKEVERDTSRKIFVLDTSVLVYDPNSIYSFSYNDVILPITVLDELDKLKSLHNETGRNARVSIRNLDQISNTGDLINGISLDDGIVFKIDTSAYGAIGLDPSYGDSKILGSASKLQLDNKDKKVVLVSKDINLRVRAKAFGLNAEDYEKDKIVTSELYQGFRTIEDVLSGKLLQENSYIPADSFGLYPNEFILFVDQNGSGIAAGRCVDNQIKLAKDLSPWGLKLRGKEQLFAVDLMMDTNVPLVSMAGRSGSGKTLCAVACALELVLNKKFYDSLIIYRPIQTVGNELGYLPGNLAEKLEPYYSPINDAFSYLFSDKSRKKDAWKTLLFQYLDNGTIQQEAIAFVRGRSITNSVVLIDEAQNLSRGEIKTLLTRAGTNTKFIITGDLEQIDSPMLDAFSNGLTYLIDKFKDYDIAGHVCLNKGERSRLATIASEIL